MKTNLDQSVKTQMNSISTVSSTRSHAHTNFCLSPKVSLSFGIPGRKPRNRPGTRTNNALVYIEATRLQRATLRASAHLSPASHPPFTCPLEPTELSRSPSTFDLPIIASIFTTHNYSHLSASDSMPLLEVSLDKLP